MVFKVLISLLAFSATTAVVSAHDTPVGTLKFDFHQIAFGTRKLSKDLQCKREEAAQGLFESLCKGLGDEKSRILAFTDDRKIQRSNSALSGCANDPCKRNGKNFACVQFPWANTIESGSKSFFTCVPPLTQYFQGDILATFRVQTKIASGQKFEVEICNFDCKTLKPAPSNHRRWPAPELLQQGRLETFPPFTENDQGLNTGIVALPQTLEAGRRTTDNYAIRAGGHARRDPGDTDYVDQGKFAVLDSNGAGLASAPESSEYSTVHYSRDLSIRDDLWHTQHIITLNFTLPYKTCGLGLFIGAHKNFLDVTTELTRLS